MSARYVPPFGAVGRALDRALLSRVAEATVKDFLDRVAGTTSRASSGGPDRRALDRGRWIGYHRLMAEPKTRPRVMLVDDHEVVRDGIRAMLAPRTTST